MNKLYSFFATLSLCLMLSVTVFAQTLTQTEQILFNLDALHVMEDYERFSSMANAETQYQFLHLFESESTLVFNDLLGLSEANEMPVREYVDLLKPPTGYPSVKIKNLAKSEKWQQDGVWLMDVTFNKEISYTNKCEILLSSKEYYNKDYSMNATLAWNPQTRSCKIIRITGSMDSEVKPLPHPFMVLTRTNEKDNIVTYLGSKLSFNSFDQAFLPIEAKERTKENPFSVGDDDTKIKLLKNADIDNDCDIYSLSYKSKHWRTKLHFDFVLGNGIVAEGGANGIDEKQNSMEFGVDLGYVIPSASKLKTGIFLGVGYSSTSYDLAIPQMCYQYSASGVAEIDGDDYNRYYNITDLKQSYKLSSISVPLYADFEYRFNGLVSAYVDLGAKMYYNMSLDASDFSGKYTAYGVYPQYQNLVILSDINGFAKDGSLTNSNLINADLKPNTITVDGMAALGCRVKLIDNLYFDLSASYQMGFMNVYDNNANPVTFTVNTPEYGSVSGYGSSLSISQAMVAFPQQGGREEAHHLLDCYKSLKRQSLRINAGIMFKF